MATIKTHDEPQPKTTSAATPTQQPALPEKQAGPRRMSVQRATDALPPPDGTPPPARAAGMIDDGNVGTAQRAHMMRAMQGGMGNARVNRMIDAGSPRIQRTCACGGEAGPDGECADCKAKRMAVQRQKIKSSSPDTLQPGTNSPLHDQAATAPRPNGSPSLAPTSGTDADQGQMGAQGRMRGIAKQTACRVR